MKIFPYFINTILLLNFIKYLIARVINIINISYKMQNFIGIHTNIFLIDNRKMHCT